MRAKATLSAVTLMITSSAAHAEVFCTTRSYDIGAYVYGLPVLENVVFDDGNRVGLIDLCADVCDSRATDRRYALAMTAKSRGVPLLLYFGNLNSCSGIPAHTKPYLVRMAQ